MNIFILDYNLEKSAQYAVDKHVVKMPLESTQLLCTCLHLNNINAPYKLSHKNHPCSIWVRESSENFNYLIEFAYQQFKEFEYRFNKTHKSLEVLKYCDANRPKLNNLGLTNFSLAMPDQYKCNDSVESYRNYYCGEKLKIKKYTKREEPIWFKELELV